MMLFLGRALD